MVSRGLCRQLFLNHAGTAGIAIIIKYLKTRMKGKIKMNKNKILTAVMAGTMIMGSVLPVCAETTEPQTVAQTEADEGTTRNTEVLYEQTSTFTVTIPKKIVLGSDRTSDYTVNVKGDISSDKQVKVAPETSFLMKDQSTVGIKKADVTATVTQNDIVWSSAEVCNKVEKEGTDKAGNVSATDLTSGSWAGTFEFSIALENVPTT